MRIRIFLHNRLRAYNTFSYKYPLSSRVATSEEPTSLTALQRPTTVFSSSSEGSEGSDGGEERTAAAATSSGGGSSPPSAGGQGRGSEQPPEATSSAGKATVEYSWDGQPITRAKTAYISTNYQGKK